MQSNDVIHLITFYLPETKSEKCRLHTMESFKSRGKEALHFSGCHIPQHQ
jgi:hypothetical protein